MLQGEFSNVFSPLPHCIRNIIEDHIETPPTLLFNQKQETCGLGRTRIYSWHGIYHVSQWLEQHCGFGSMVWASIAIYWIFLSACFCGFTWQFSVFGKMGYGKVCPQIDKTAVTVACPRPKGWGCLNFTNVQIICWYVTLQPVKFEVVHRTGAWMEMAYYLCVGEC